MTLTIPLKLSQTTVAISLLLAAVIFGVGYLAGRYVESSANRRQIDELHAKLLRVNEANMQFWMENYSERFRHPPEMQGPPDAAGAGQ
ncbi:MAG TPA: hypothetical protein VHB99_17315 [Pirellulales bacterium]|nr:hypothetical protein [Pirellulales bacterium]